MALPLITYRRERAKIMQAAGCKFLKDGFRHSFGTYHLAAFEDANKTALAMGHAWQHHPTSVRLWIG